MDSRKCIDSFPIIGMCLLVGDNCLMKLPPDGCLFSFLVEGGTIYR